MIYLLDTDTFIYMARGRKSTRAAQRQRAQLLAQRCKSAQTAGDVVGLSAITVSELEFGAQNSGRYDAEMATVHKLLAPFEIYDYDAVSCPAHYGSIRHKLQSRGLSIGAMDLLIAAHASALDATLVSNNLAHFARVPGLKTTNWSA